MSKSTSFLTERFKTQKKEKVSELVKRSSRGGLSVFQGVPISKSQEDSLKGLLEKYQTDGADLSQDLRQLKEITSEVKAINNQAVILHGERIKSAQTLFRTYREGAFGAWLLKIYGNRQTPYNFLKYYELYSSFSTKIRSIIDEMPRQAIYSLSSRSIPQEQKEAFIRSYRGETKAELLQKLREVFPLPKRDKRDSNRSKALIGLFKSALKIVKHKRFSLKKQEREEVEKLLREIHLSVK